MKSAYAALTRLDENPPETISELRTMEANCAVSYFRSWAACQSNGAVQAVAQFPIIGML